MSVAHTLEKVLTAIRRAASKAGRDPASVTLVAISKKQTSEQMQQYLAAAAVLGLPVIFGENYLQELKAKRPLFSTAAQFHVTGPLQSNKIRDAVRLADVIQSVHSEAVLTGIAQEAARQGKQQRIFLQVNIGEDPKKSGFSANEVIPMIERIATSMPTLSLVGLMTITPYYDEPELGRSEFIKLRNVRDAIIAAGKAAVFEDGKVLLSMGMSADFEIAIEEGADLIRVGTALFGERGD
jgi:pyridoxal phosphate enzyme (YggS family)